MEKKFKWKFIDSDGTFICENPQKINSIYFPVCNEAGLMSSVTPYLGGDCKKNQNEFLYLPVSVEDLHNNRSSRNFWIYTKEKGAFSVSGNSARQRTQVFETDKNADMAMVEGGMLYHRLHTKIQELNLKCKVTTFCPANEDLVEINVIEIENYGKESIRFTPTAAFPIFGRSADNIRDHRHATSLMHRVSLKKNGIVVKPTIHHDERGHEPNYTSYFVYGATGEGKEPTDIFPTVAEFIGEGGTFDWPEAVVTDKKTDATGKYRTDGMECVGALKFDEIQVLPKQSVTYIICAGITYKADFEEEFAKYNNKKKIDSCFYENRSYWKKEISTIEFMGKSDEYDGWLKWVSLQPILRKIYGCSFLPYHDYGRGGRGWRDLWQDYLTLLLQKPEGVREILVKNFKGVRLDGSNATIIREGVGKFLADRNNISRVWMDHGAWPFFTVKLYINQTGDIQILDEKVSYWRDQQLERAKKIDRNWNKGDVNEQLTTDGNTYEGTVLEHILLENLICCYNLGEHGNIKLEDGDWNDQLDLAPDKGETIPFTAFYGMNLCDLADMLKRYAYITGKEKIEVFEQMELLLQSSQGMSPSEKREILRKYFESLEKGLNGRKSSISIVEAANLLENKGKELLFQVRNHEWIQTEDGYGFFNGYYNNDGQAVDRDLKNGNARMGLTAQTFTVMSGAATEEQVKQVIASVNHFLPDPHTGGLRLTMPLGDNTWNFGRGFALVYGEKENGGMFSHMTVMYAYALYSRGFVKEGYQVLKGIYDLCTDMETAQIYPGIPEYISNMGRGMYSYVTGAGSWTVFTMLTQVYGIKGNMGDLVIEPKLTADQFLERSFLYVKTGFGKRRWKVVFANPEKLDYGEYIIGSASLNDVSLRAYISGNRIIIPMATINKLTDRIEENEIKIQLMNK